MAIPIQRRLSRDKQKRIDDQAAEEARALEEIEAEGAAEVETIGKTWGLSPEEIAVILRGKFLPLYIRGRQAARDISKNGLTVSDHYGRQRINPAVVIEKDSISAQMRILKQLNIGGETPEPAAKTRPWGNTR